MLRPRGVRRYLQNTHHDRHTAAYFRDPTRPDGLRAVVYDEAITRVAAEIQRIKSKYGNDAFAVLGGASMTTEKCYLLGKFARVCLKTRCIDYNGRLCMVSAAAGNKKAFGIDRAGNPMSDIPLAEVIWIGGVNVAGCAPITTSYVWQARENGANHQRRPRHHPARADLRPRAAGQARPGRGPVRRRPAPDDRERLARPRVHQQPHRRVRDGGRGGAGLDPAEDGRGDRRRRAGDPAGGRVVGDGKDQLPDARPRDGAAQPRGEQLPGVDQHGAGQRADWPAGVRVLDHHRPGERPGRAGAWAEGRPTPRRPGHQEPGAPAVRRRGVPEAELPRAGVDCYEILRKVEAGEINGLLSWSFNPAVSLPDSTFVKRMLEKLEFFACIDFFLSETARFADVVLPGSQHEEDEGTVW